MDSGRATGAPRTETATGPSCEKASSFRGTIPAVPPEPGRYHLVVAWTCPWAHRVLITRALKGLSDRIPVHFANTLSDRSWRFDSPGDSPHGDDYLYQLYLRADPRYTGRVTVPVLWDEAEGRIVNNESSKILRILDALPSEAPSLRPPEQLPAIEALSDAMYDSLNNGVYRAGLATTQAAYDEAVRGVFDTLDRLERHLEGRDWLVGDRLSEADIRLFVTTFRFDAAYVPFFRCNLRRLADYPRLSAHMRRVYWTPGVAETSPRSPRRGRATG